MTFHEKLETLINNYFMENGSNTPDYILANYLLGCLKVFDQTVKDRDKWYLYGEVHYPGKEKP